MRILVLGGAGYVGSRLIPVLLEKDYHVTVYDLYLYGTSVLTTHQNLTQIQGDVRNLPLLKEAMLGMDALIHLACISNDPSFELNPTLGKSINLDAFEPCVKMAKESGIRRFIYASSSSVYGIKTEPNVHEEMSLQPLTDYSKFKAMCEEILFKYTSDHFITTVIRPATVCGYAPRQRLDLVVNILTNLAYNTGKIKVMGGAQLRPNIHIEDMVRAYIHILESNEAAVQGEIFNAGYHNYSVLDLGKMVQKVVSTKKPVELEVVPTDDNRSYHVSSEKIAEKLGFKPMYSIENAVEDLVEAFDAKKLDNPLENMEYFNIKKMKAVHLE